MFPMLLALFLILGFLRLKDDDVEDDGDAAESDSGDSDSEDWRNDEVSEKCPES